MAGPAVIVTSVGAALVGLVGAQVLLSIFATLRRSYLEAVRHRQSLALLQTQIDAAKALRLRNESARAAWNGYRKFVVTRKVLEADDICTLYLAPHDRKPLPAFQPGQFLTFRMEIPNQEKDVIRCYSLSDRPDSDHYRITVKQIPPPADRADLPPGLASTYLYERTAEGAILDVRAPAGNFVLEPDKARPAVLIAGGVGVTPMLSMVNSIACGSNREVWLFYGVRHGGEHIMKEHLRELDQRHAHIHIIVCYSQPREEDVEGRDFDRTGWMGVDVLKGHFETNNYEFYVCGPPAMMESVTEQLADWGVPREDIRTEAFGPASVKARAAAAHDRSEESAPQSCKVRFAKYDKEFLWEGKADNLLEFGEVSGVPLEGGCRAGNCGTCEVAVLSGDVEYNREPEYPELRDGSCLTCIGVPKGDVVLDA